jgi:hypothetical protein
MRWNADNGSFQASADASGLGNGTHQNENEGQSNYNIGDPIVVGYNFDSLTGEAILASSLNDYSETFVGVSPGDFSVGSASTDTLGLGTANNGSRYFEGNIAEVMIYDAALSADDFAAAMTALEAKWIVPEPGAAALAALAIGCCCACRRRMT